MPRPKNNLLHEQMTRAARRLFLEQGYAGTSYADIADACGVAKTNVQQHFPKKDLFIRDFFRDLLDESDAFFEARGERTDNYYVNLYRIGQVFFAFLLSSEEMVRFTTDVISHRELTEIMIDLEVDWATSYEVGFTKEELGTFADDIAMIMGGIYELLYRQLRRGGTLSPQEIQTRIMTLFAFTRGLSRAETEALFPKDLIPEEEFTEAIRHLHKKLFS